VDSSEDGCITELGEPDEWENMPLGRTTEPSTIPRKRAAERKLRLKKAWRLMSKTTKAMASRKRKRLECKLILAVPNA
jgi:hypothetical protein